MRTMRGLFLAHSRLRGDAEAAPNVAGSAHDTVLLCR